MQRILQGIHEDMRKQQQQQQQQQIRTPPSNSLDENDEDGRSSSPEIVSVLNTTSAPSPIQQVFDLTKIFNMNLYSVSTS